MIQFTTGQRSGAGKMSKTLSREVIEELQRYKAGAAPRPRLRRADAVIEPEAVECERADISELVAALVMSTQQTIAAEIRKSSAPFS